MLNVGLFYSFKHTFKEETRHYKTIRKMPKGEIARCGIWAVLRIAYCESYCSIHMIRLIAMIERLQLMANVLSFLS